MSKYISFNKKEDRAEFKKGGFHKIRGLQYEVKKLPPPTL